jgi:hypothetical protein
MAKAVPFPMMVELRLTSVPTWERGVGEALDPLSWFFESKVTLRDSVPIMGCFEMISLITNFSVLFL